MFVKRTKKLPELVAVERVFASYVSLSEGTVQCVKVESMVVLQRGVVMLVRCVIRPSIDTSNQYRELNVSDIRRNLITCEDNTTR